MVIQARGSFLTVHCVGREIIAVLRSSFPGEEGFQRGNGGKRKFYTVIERD